jgi:hypothetical protein
MLTAERTPALERTEMLFFKVIRQVTGLDEFRAKELLEREGVIDSEDFMFVWLGVDR